MDARDFGQMSNDPAPLYHRIVAQIRKHISEHKVPPGTKLPSEEELARHFGVSSITIRAALKELADSGLIDRRQGRGTFVRDVLPRATEWSLGSVEDIVMTSRLSQAVLVRHGYSRTPAWARAALSLPNNGRAFNLQVIRKKEGKPFMLTDGYFPPSIGDRLAAVDMAEALNRNRLLIGIVEEVTGERYTEIRQTIVADLATADVAKKLGIDPGTPVLVVKRLSCAEDGRILQAGRSYCRTTDFAFSIHLKRV